MDVSERIGEVLRAGVAAHRGGNAREAERRYRAVLASDPENADALNLLGALAGEAGRAQEAVGLIMEAVRLRPGIAMFRLNLGIALRVSGRILEAIEALQAALALQPELIEAQLSLGHSLFHLHRHREAEDWYRRVLTRVPQHREARMSLIRILEFQGKVAEADTHYEAYARLYPEDDAMRFRQAVLMPPIAHSRSDISRWRDRFERNLTRLSGQQLRIGNPLEEIGAVHFFLAYHGIGNRGLATLAARVIATACPDLLWEAPECRAWRGPAQRIKVGFVSKFMCEHSIGKTTQGLVEKIDRERFEVSALFVPPRHTDAVSQAISASADHAVTLSGTLAGAREQIGRLGLDVLFYQDIGMEPFTYFLAFSRLAPVQCVSFGHPDTTGIPAMDYFISSDLFEMEGAEKHYSERLFLLRSAPTLAYYYRPALPADLLTRARLGLPEDRRLYLCPQTLFKLHPDFDDVLMRILEADAEGILVLVQPQSEHWLRLVIERFEARMPGISSRLLILPLQPRERFLNLLAVADVVLDTPHFNGMNSSLEAFAVGTPVVTMPGELQRSRHTQAMYRSMGIHDLIVNSPEDYVRLAVSVASNPLLQQQLRERILAANGVLFESTHVVREFERFFTSAVVERARQPS